MLLISKCIPDAFGGEDNHPCGTPYNVPPNSIVSIDLQLASFKPVIDITGDSKVLKKILQEGEGTITANEGASVTGKYFYMNQGNCQVECWKLTSQLERNQGYRILHCGQLPVYFFVLLIFLPYIFLQKLELSLLQELSIS